MRDGYPWGEVGWWERERGGLCGALGLHAAAVVRVDDGGGLKRRARLQGGLGGSHCTFRGRGAGRAAPPGCLPGATPEPSPFPWPNTSQRETRLRTRRPPPATAHQADDVVALLLGEEVVVEIASRRPGEKLDLRLPAQGARARREAQHQAVARLAGVRNRRVASACGARVARRR